MNAQAIDQLHAERVGHGYRALTSAELWSRLRVEGVHLEMCPTSSLATGAVQPPLANHPLKQYAYTVHM